MSDPTKKICPRWRNAFEIHDGIENTVRHLVIRARMASHDARDALKLDRQGNTPWAHADYVRYRAERRHWIWAAKILLAETTRGVAHFHSNDRKVVAALAGGAK